MLLRLKSILSLFVVGFLTICIFQSCTTKTENSAEKKTMENMALLQADVAFSTLSKSKGMKTAFLEYLDSNATILRPGHLPIEGAGAIDYLIQQDDAAVSYSWDPHHAEVAQSGDLGYTYGVYLMQSKETEETKYGTYVSVWKKQSDGNWKLLIHSANEGVDE